MPRRREREEASRQEEKRDAKAETGSHGYTKISIRRGKVAGNSACISFVSFVKQHARGIESSLNSMRQSLFESFS